MTGQVHPTQNAPGVDSSDLGAPPLATQDEFVTVITQKLSAPLTAPPRGPVSTAPAGLDEALQELGSSDPISHVFEAQGFWSWLAYFFATKSASQSKDLSQALSNIPPDILSGIARHVSQVEVELSLTQRIQHTLWLAKRGPQRRYQLLEAGMADFPPEPSTTSSSSVQPRKRPYAQAFDDADVSANRRISPRNNTVQDTTQVSQQAASHPIDPLLALNNTHHITCNTDPQYSYSYPDAGNIPLVFGPALNNFIVRSDFNTASIFASLPPDPTKCRLDLDIKADEVGRIAKAIFNTDIVVRGQRRALYLEGGRACALIKTSLVLGCTDICFWDDLLGNTVRSGVRNSHEYLEEVRQGINPSSVLTMEVPGALDLPARISLPIHEFVQGDIIKKLWQL